MSEDLVQLAAYALVLIIIGGASILKKIYEERKKRRLLEASRPQPRIDQTRSLRPPDLSEAKRDTESREVSEPVTLEEETEGEPEETPVFDMEEVLRRLLRMPAEGSTRTKRRKELRAIPVTPPAGPLPKADTPVASLRRPESRLDWPEKVTPLRTGRDWEEFTQELEASGWSDLEKAIIFTEILSPPPALRRGGQFWRRGRLFG